MRLRAACNKSVSGTWEITNLRFDDAELVLVKMALEAEPAAVKEIKSDILSRKMVLNYPDYVGADWKTALGLPQKVEIVTDNGDTVEVGVTWSFAELDFSKYGKYTLYGTLDDSNFPNPNGIKAVQNIYVGKASNLLTNPRYARPFNICGGFNLSDIQMCRDNTFRRNRAYDMTTSSHLFGENNLVYSNLFSFHHMTFNEDGTLFEGKQAMPGAFDTIIYSDHTSMGNMLVNNTFYNCGSAICISDTAHTVINNIYANNLIVNWSADVPNYPGSFYASIFTMH